MGYTSASDEIGELFDYLVREEDAEEREKIAYDIAFKIEIMIDDIVEKKIHEHYVEYH